MKKTLYLFSMLPLLLSLASCDDDGTTGESTDYSAEISNIANKVIVATYQDLSDNANALLAALESLESNPTPGNLETSRQAWRDTRRPWEQSEGFLFGPVDTKGIDPSLDSWPVNKIDLDNVLASGNPLTETYIDALEGTLKGFHTIEYLLWGESGDKQMGEFTARQFEYLLATAQMLAADAGSLYSSWSPDGENFVANLLNAGETGSIYISQKSVLEEFVNGMTGIADEVGNGKINDPFEEQDLSLEESQFSHNSKADFSDNIRSIQHIYLGSYKGEGSGGVGDIVAELGADVDSKVKTQITEAINAIEDIPGTFSDAVFNSQAAVADAQQKVRTLQTTFESEVSPLISNLQ